MVRVGKRIRHALNEGEVRFPSPLGGYYRLDGYYRDPTSGQQLGFEYKYCVLHGCYCIDRDVQDPYDKHTMTGRYAQTAEKVRILEAARIKVITKWDHDFQRKMKNDTELKAFLTTVDLED